MTGAFQAVTATSSAHPFVLSLRGDEGGRRCLVLVFGVRFRFRFRGGC